MSVCVMRRRSLMVLMPASCSALRYFAVGAIFEPLLSFFHCDTRAPSSFMFPSCMASCDWMGVSLDVSQAGVLHDSFRSIPVFVSTMSSYSSPTHARCSGTTAPVRLHRRYSGVAFRYAHSVGMCTPQRGSILRVNFPPLWCSWTRLSSASEAGTADGMLTSDRPLPRNSPTYVSVPLNPTNVRVVGAGMDIHPSFSCLRYLAKNFSTFSIRLFMLRKMWLMRSMVISILLLSSI
mmetsp:Transcript_51846/g.130146  ORF Transcript_51846/g.130146 Transcript_51846/m.130146 type:complete len:235 (-) Transcript_51846:1646-2350(-)